MEEEERTTTHSRLVTLNTPTDIDLTRAHSRKSLTSLFSGWAALRRSEKALQRRRVASRSRSSCSSCSMRAEMSLTPLAISGKLEEIVEIAAPTAW